MSTCALHNLGCKVNSYETQAMQKMMEEAGYTIIPFGEEPADIYIINTCSVTNIADRKSRQMIHKARKLNPDAVIVATGCYVESAGAEIDKDVDVIIGNNEKSRLLGIIDDYLENRKRGRLPDISSEPDFDEMELLGDSDDCWKGADSDSHTRAYVKIQDGCNRFCSYCIIPYVRGRIRSRRADDAINEITHLAAAGCREVVLTGIHLSSYGLDKESDGTTLIELVERAEQIQGIERIRLGSLEPLIVTEEFAARLAACKKICPHFHLSLQSGCDETLKRMNRRYTTQQFYRGVEILRKYFDKPAITTDVIVGFPGETQEEFAQTVEFLEKVKFYELHVFKYSRRKGTVADKMPGQLTEKEKAARSDVLLELDDRLSADYRRRFVGRRVKVLTEENMTVDGITYMTGFTDTYVKVAIEQKAGNEITSNRLIDVIVTDYDEKKMKEMVIAVAEN